MGINRKTQQKIKIPAKTVVKFRVAKAAKDAVTARENQLLLFPLGGSLLFLAVGAAGWFFEINRP